MEQLPLPNIINQPTNNIETMWETLINHIFQGANNFIPKKSYKIIPSLTESTRTKNLQRIFSERHNLYKHNLTPDEIQILNNIKNHINSSKQKELCEFWSNKMDELKELHSKHDAKNLYRNIKNLMGKPNFNKGTYLIHNRQQIHDKQEQANIFSNTWAEIMTPNTPRGTRVVQEHIQNILTWTTLNRDQIKPLTTINRK